MKLTVVALASWVLLQSGNPASKDLLNLQRSLTAAEMETVVGGIRRALAGQRLRLVRDRGGNPEILLGPDGMPLRVRIERDGPPEERIATVTVDGAPGSIQVLRAPEPYVYLTEYTSAPARRCNGAPGTADMVLEYLQNTTTQAWTVRAREYNRGDTGLAQPLEMLRAAASLTVGGRRMIGQRAARALVSPWPKFDKSELRITGDPAPDPADFVPTQLLWIDTGSLLPLRWELSERQAIVGAADFVYQPLDIQRPAGLSVPVCIP